MKVRVKGPITQVENRDYGKKTELPWGGARVNTLRVRVFSKEEAEEMTVGDLCAPAEEATIEVYGSVEHVAAWRQRVREDPNLELIEEGAASNAR